MWSIITRAFLLLTFHPESSSTSLLADVTCENTKLKLDAVVAFTGIEIGWGGYALDFIAIRSYTKLKCMTRKCNLCMHEKPMH